VTVDVPPGTPSAVLDAVRNYVQRFPAWGVITTQTWIVATDASAIQVRDAFLQLVPAESTVFVLRSGREAAWENVPSDDEWLRGWL